MRTIFGTFRLMACAALLLALPCSVVAGAPQLKTGAPGYYRMMLGDFEITVLSDGTVDLEVTKLLTNTTPAKIKAALARSFLKDPVETSVNAFLVNTGEKLVLIDAGAGALFGPTLGRLGANLVAAGYQPEQIDEIYITHMHPDHVGGLSSGDKPAFPNAIVRADRREAAFWLSQANLEKAPAADKGFFQGVMAALSPYVTSDRFKPFDGGAGLTPGIRTIATRGHTVGHMVYVVESKGQRLALWGDLIHVAAVQFADPAVTIRFDSDSKAAADQRKKEFADAAKRGNWVGAAHLPFPGIGRVRSEGQGYAWVPANYSVPR